VSFCYTEAKRQLFAGLLDLNGGDDIRALLVLAASTADTEPNVTNLAGFATLGEITDGSYSRVALAAETVTADTTNHLAKFTATSPLSWLGLTSGGSVKGMIIYKHVAGGDANCTPIFYIDQGGFPFTMTGADLNANQHPTGWAHET
jgi:hypothetical protein